MDNFCGAHNGYDIDGCSLERNPPLPMSSAALVEWQTHRTGRIAELFAAHAEITGRGRDLRRTQLNWALTIRITAEFQGFARDLHNLAVDEISNGISEVSPVLAPIVRKTMKTSRRLDRGNPGPVALDHDFDLLGMDIWREIDVRYPGQVPVAKHDLEALLRARNAIAHSDERKLTSVEALGYPLSDVETVRNWLRRTSKLCGMMDVCTAAYIGRVAGGEQPW